jgi:hypothetical protein
LPTNFGFRLVLIFVVLGTAKKVLYFYFFYCNLSAFVMLVMTAINLPHTAFAESYRFWFLFIVSTITYFKKSFNFLHNFFLALLVAQEYVV